MDKGTLIGTWQCAYCRQLIELGQEHNCAANEHFIQQVSGSFVPSTLTEQALFRIAIALEKIANHLEGI